jgi:exodeoxyribonuclease VII large subunit
VPVIAGIGHEVDFTIADLVADVRAATPSNAAELVVDRADNFRSRITQGDARLRRAIARVTDARRQRHDRLDLRLRHWPVAVLMRDRDVEEQRLRLRHLVSDRLARLGQRFDALRRRLEQRDVRRVASALRTRLVRADARLVAAMSTRRTAADARSRELAARLHTLSPLAVLGRGYAVCWNEARTGIIRSSSAVRPGDAVQVTLAEGEIDCRVERTKP